MNCNTATKYIFLSFLFFAIACSEPEKPVTKEEAAAVATSLANAFAHRNASRFNELLDLDAFKKRIMSHAGNKLAPATVEGVMKSMRSGEFGLQIVRALGNKGTYELVKQYEKDNHQHLVFRLYNEQLNYHDLEIIKKGNQVKIADIFVYITGENLSSTLAESLQSMTEQEEAVKEVGKRDVKKVQLIKKYINANDYERASQVFETLPAVLKEQKLIKMIYVQIASGLGNDKYLAALNKFQQEYPDAPNMYLLMVDAYFLKKDFPAALKCINRLDSLINKDPFLDYYRALICKESDDNVNKLVYLKRLHQNMPGFGSGTLELINTYVDDKQWDQAVPLTQQYRKSKNADTTTLKMLYLLNPDFKKKMKAADYN
ncbi:hypothetical protein SAMN04488505_101492 [Chitinophaga rupis]|uniref:Tetratricopeptide repeat-containing protein n=1 Tax=Chitinophaga rupis TaxID=573321 RepID=A0A1H7I8Q1_9BACT|nr:hypothetical protein [Chitinophaga rupis]SEK58943.1 hypothetical protein SAMN04488505_101492 [Chitinophaga rupis]